MRSQSSSHVSSTSKSQIKNTSSMVTDSANALLDMLAKRQTVAAPQAKKKSKDKKSEPHTPERNSNAAANKKAKTSLF